MADPACIAAIRGVAPHLSEADAATIDDTVAAFRKRRQAHNALVDLDAATIAEAKRLGDQAVLNAMIEKRNAAKNVLARQKRDVFYERARSESGATDAEAVSAVLATSERPLAGAAPSIDAKGKGYLASLIGPFVADLRKDGLLDVLNWRKRSAEFDRRVENELARLTDDTQGVDTGDPRAKRVADLVHRLQESARQMQNDTGAWIGKLPGYIVRQSHDQFRIRKAGFEAWRGVIEPLLDERTFDGVSDRTEFLRRIWTNLATGNHLAVDGAAGAKDAAFTGPGNLAKRLSAERVMHFQNADAAHAYREAFGGVTLMEAVLGGAERAVRNTALMERFGTNPEAAFKADLERLQIAAKDRGDLDAVDALNAKKLRDQFAEVSGASRIPENVTMARWAQFVRDLISISSLGGVLLSSIPDIAVRMGTLRWNGVNMLEGYGRAFEGFAINLSQDERRQASDMLAVGFDAMIGGLMRKAYSGDGVPGVLTRLVDIFHKTNGLTYWTDAHKAGMGVMLARNLAMHQDRDFASLDPRLQTTLKRYGIGDREWSVLQQADSRAAGDTRLLMPESVADLDDAAVRPLYEAPWRERADAMTADLEERRQRFVSQAAREDEWIDKRVDKFQAKLAKAKERYDRLADRSNERLDQTREAAAARIDKLQALLDQAQLEADALRSQRRERLRDIVTGTAGDVAATAERPQSYKRSARIGVAERGADQAERTGEQMARAGEAFGERRTQLERRLAELDQRILAADRAAAGEQSARGEAFRSYWTEKQDELTGWIGELQARRADRQALLEDLEGGLPDRIERERARLERETRIELEMRLRTYYVDQVGEALNESTAREAALFSQGTRPGTAIGEALRFFTQLKKYPVTFFTRQLGREIYRDGLDGSLVDAARELTSADSRIDRMGLFHLIAATTILGYGAMTAKDTVKGRNPRDPTDPRTWMASMQQGGGLGIYGDFLFGQYNRFGGGPIETLAGPLPGRVGELLRAFSQARDGKDPTSTLYRAGLSWVPFNNVFWARVALDYGVLHQVQEIISPGSLRRAEQRQAKENGVTYWLKPSEAIPYGGGSRPFEGLR